MLGLCLFVAYPAVAHFGAPRAALALLAALVAYILLSFTDREMRWIGVPAAAALTFWAAPPVEWLLYLPPVMINLVLAWLFGRTLVSGRVPLIARFAMIEQGTLSAELERYTRTLTWIWTVLFIAAAAVSLSLALSGDRDAWSLFTNLVNYLLVGALFIGEFAYRRLRYRNYRHHSPLELVRNVRGTKLFER